MNDGSIEDILVATFLVLVAYLAYRYKSRNDINKIITTTNSEKELNPLSGPTGWISIFQTVLIFNAFIGGAPQFALIHDIKRNFENISIWSDWQFYINFSYAFALINFIFSIYIFYRLQRVLLKSTVNLVFFFIGSLIFLECINLLLFITSDFFKVLLS